MNDNLRRWLAPLIAEAHSRGLELSGELLTAGTPEDGRLNTRTNWLKFGQLVIARLGWNDTYPSTPEEMPRERLEA